MTKSYANNVSAALNDHQGDKKTREAPYTIHQLRLRVLYRILAAKRGTQSELVNLLSN